MPELPEVEALAAFLRERAVGRVIERADVAAISVLKTYQPDVTELRGRTITGARRHGKFLDLDVSTGGSPLHLVMHLARGGWLRWRDSLPDEPTRPGKGPLAFRVRLDDGSGFDLTEAGTKKRLAVYLVTDPDEVPGVARLGPDPLAADFTVETLAGLLRRPPDPDQGTAPRPVGDRRDWQRVLRRGAARGADVAVPAGCQPERRRGSRVVRRDRDHAARCGGQVPAWPPGI